MAFWLLRSRELWDQERCLKRIEFFFFASLWSLCASWDIHSGIPKELNE